MTARILDGKALAERVKAEVADRVARLPRPPALATVLVGDDPASHTYVRGKRRDAEQVGMVSIHHQFDADISQEALEDVIFRLNSHPEVDGILVQLPLPAHLDSAAITESIDPAKDVDGLHPHNLGLLVLDRPGPRPCTPAGVLRILDELGVRLEGTRAVVVGRSFLVGRPLALMLAQKGVDATVTLAHSRTRDLAELTRSAEVLVAAAGSPHLIGAEHVGEGAVVIDVGVNRTAAGLVGDVDLEAVAPIASAVTPVPGGVGPMTRAMLMLNTVALAERRAGRLAGGAGKPAN